MKAILITASFCGLLPRLTWAAAGAQTAPGVDWWTVDGGGGTVDGSGPAGTYTLVGTAGQPDAGVMAGGDYLLAGGFLPGGTPPERHRIFLALLVRSE